MTRNEFMAYANLSHTTVARLLKGELQHTRVGRKVLIPLAEANKFLGLKTEQ